MSATIWGKFFWSDWLADPGLRACSYGARGLWMDMLCIAAGAQPKGYVSVAGRACDAKAIARLTGGQIEEVTALLAELEEHGVFSRDQGGAIFSRRMVADAERSRTGSVYGKHGGPSPELPLPIGGGGGVNAKDPPGVNGTQSQKPESRSQSPDFRKGVRVRASAPHPLPVGWQLSPEDLAYASGKGFDERTACEMAEAFGDHHRNRGTRGLDWAAAWRTWCRNEVKFSAQRGLSNGGRRETNRSTSAPYGSIAAKIFAGNNPRKN